MGIVRATDFDLSKYSEETTFILDTNILYFVHSGYYLPTDPKCICYSNLIQNIMSNGRTIVVSALNVQELLFGIEGKEYKVIPKCMHLGCELSWNALDKTWDCPCHGSRYTYDGKLIYGPSKKDLKKIK